MFHLFIPAIFVQDIVCFNLFFLIFIQNCDLFVPFSLKRDAAIGKFPLDFVMLWFFIQSLQILFGFEMLWFMNMPKLTISAPAT